MQSTSDSIQYEYLEEIEDDFVCMVCLHPLFDPIVHNSLSEDVCGKMFCKSCFTPCQHCPHCREEVSSKTIHPVPLFVRTRVDNIGVKCPTCSSKVKRKELLTHIVKCATKCPFGCTQLVAPSDVNQHELVCTEKPVDCQSMKEMCPWKGPKRLQEKHERECHYVALKPVLVDLFTRISKMEASIERLEKERLEKERLEKERLEKERLEKERLEKERLEKERLEKERLEKERLEKEKLFVTRISKMEASIERLEKERLEERLEKERLEKDCIMTYQSSGRTVYLYMVNITRQSLQKFEEFPQTKSNTLKWFVPRDAKDAQELIQNSWNNKRKNDCTWTITYGVSTVPSQRLFGGFKVIVDGDGAHEGEGENGACSGKGFTAIRKHGCSFGNPNLKKSLSCWDEYTESIFACESTII